MKKILLEAKSISDAVIKLTNIVGKGIINDASKQKMNRSEQTDVNFIENEYQISVDGYLKRGNVLTVHYIMYCLETQREYYILLPKLGKTANSEADTETNTIKIVSSFIGNDVSEDFYETISHELEHLYQYGKGMKKREDLYDRAVAMVNKKDKHSKYVGLCCYYSFKHEQDAFVHQFYTFLQKSNKQSSFNDYLNIFQPYQMVNEVYNFVINNQDDNNVMKSINELGFTRKKFINLIYYRINRFDTKLYNAYCRYVTETEKLYENGIDRLVSRIVRRIEEIKKMGYDIECGIESIYNF
jgi:hypothetical protein